MTFLLNAKLYTKAFFYEWKSLDEKASEGRTRKERSSDSKGKFVTPYTQTSKFFISFCLKSERFNISGMQIYLNKKQQPSQSSRIEIKCALKKNEQNQRYLASFTLTSKQQFRFLLQSSNSFIMPCSSTV